MAAQQDNSDSRGNARAVNLVRFQATPNDRGCGMDSYKLSKSEVHQLLTNWYDEELLSDFYEQLGGCIEDIEDIIQLSRENDTRTKIHVLRFALKFGTLVLDNYEPIFDTLCLMTDLLKRECDETE
jgi:hypothetical protein